MNHGMNRAGWCGAALVFTAVGAGYVWLLSSSSPRSPGENIGFWVPMVVMAAPAALAGALLWCAWWRTAGVRLSPTDAPARLLATAVATLPARAQQQPRFAGGQSEYVGDDVDRLRGLAQRTGIWLTEACAWWRSTSTRHSFSLDSLGPVFATVGLNPATVPL